MKDDFTTVIMSAKANVSRLTTAYVSAQWKNRLATLLDEARSSPFSRKAVWPEEIESLKWLGTVNAKNAFSFDDGYELKLRGREKPARINWGSFEYPALISFTGRPEFNDEVIRAANAFGGRVLPAIRELYP